MPVLHTGRRRTKLDRSYNGPPRQGPVRHISPAQLNLERVYEQNRINIQKIDATKAPEPAPGPAAKGKPRLLLMGQRRYVDTLLKHRLYSQIVGAESHLSQVSSSTRCLRMRPYFSSLLLGFKKILCS